MDKTTTTSPRAATIARARRSGWSTLAALAILATAACGGGSSGAGGDGASDELRVAHPFPIAGLDLVGPLSGDRAVLTINQNLFDSLTRKDPVSGEIVPWLAESWETTDGTSWTFTLRDDVVFHDGTPLTATDVQATIMTLIERKTPLAPIFAGVTSVEAPDDTTVVINADRPLGTLPSNVSLLGIAPADQVGSDDFNQRPIGSGVFEFESFEGGAELVLAANEDHWNGPPAAERLVFEQIPEASNRVVALETGEIDLTWGIPVDQVARLESADGVTVETVPAYVNYEILANWNRPPLDNLKVRQALAHAIDVEPIVENVLGGLGAPSSGPLPTTVFGSVELDPFEHDPDLARRLLDEAGVSDLTIKVLVRDQEVEQQVALAMISDWAEIGVTVEPDFQELATWTENYVNQNFDLSLTGRPTLTGDADYTLGRLYLSESDRVPCANAELDEPIVRGGSETDPEARQAAYDEALSYLWDNVCGIYPIDGLEAFAWNDALAGFEPPPSTIPFFADVRIEE
ncbi:ABC transporter substrate-binding protein [Jiangella asiatica]|uniref:ABC transporter substrate-binding protein n=1 Tax=Jiangella asiatica TaxID=2530372 RepID=UPI0013A5BE19|nr:ABC transporter substrate-binding protein [Jiangella asiatica]